MTTPDCKDCVAEGITTKRKLATTRGGKPVPGPRCASHHRDRRSKTRDMSWERRLIAVYGITAAMYWAIYKFQGGVCYICRRAKGSARKKLSVDHCHKTGYVRGLLCGPCNRDVLGHLRDDREALIRAVAYLDWFPAFQVGVKVITPDMAAA